MKRGEKKLTKRITDMMFRSLQFTISDKFVLGDFIIEHTKNPFTFNSYIVRIVRAKDEYTCARAKISVTIENKKYKVERLFFDTNYKGLCGKRKLIEEIKKSCRF